jgi:HD-GYP domain-containing protein (c-di-GMP phosphodiesterase class II)
LNLPEQDIRILRYGGTLHDIGKIGIAEHILGKQQALTEIEREAIRQHPVLGERIIAPIDFLQPVRPLVRHHHERIDGTGYPDGLKGDTIPLGARILNAADTFDAVTSERPYQAAVSTTEALALLHRLRGTQIDLQVCDALTVVIERLLQQGQDRAWTADEGSAAVA